MILLFLIFSLASGKVNQNEDIRRVPMECPNLVGGDMLGFDPEDRNAIVGKEKLWPGGIIPYEKFPSLSNKMNSILDRAFEHYQKLTCIKFVPRTTEKDYIQIFSGDGCYSFVGRDGGPQPVSLGEICNWEGVVIHELGHVIGFYHEQNRSDRDEYIKIYWENMKKGTENQFFKLQPHQNLLLTPFDYESIMLYGSYNSSKDREGGLRTMEGINGTFLHDPLTKGKLSKNDIKRITLLYDC
ncbi:astacin-like metalloprotease toxin 5 [Parasteatoda tepidariorum]|uniref:astacin-like metalloprotease toxin 5 n=1 Tax=Parasteatoda tepidariorum TaxID=114398 RepID=UPI001C7265FF|nr:astacin-like metalloprotease toxin 5 [Parasteatoda tepidariorum]